MQKNVGVVFTAKDKTKIALGQMRTNLSSVQRAAGALGVTFGALAASAFAKDSIDKLIKQENAVKQLEQRIKSTGGVSDKTSIELQEMASALQAVTTFGDEATIEMQSLLLTFTQVRGPVFDQAVEAILDVSTAMGQDLKSSALQVGKALNDPVGQLGALSRTGIQFSAEQKETSKTLAKMGDVAGAQGIILKELKTQFGGAARVAKDTLGGSIDTLSNSFGDLQENLAALGSDNVRGGVNVLTELIDKLNQSIAPTRLQQIEEITARIGELRAELEGASGYNSNTFFGAIAQSMYGDLDGKQAEIDRLLVQRAKLEQAGAAVRMGSVAALAYELERPIEDTQPPERGTFKGWGPDYRGGWEGQARHQIEQQRIAEHNAALLTQQQEYNAQKFSAEIEAGQQMKDLWVLKADEKIAANQRANWMIAQQEEETNARRKAAGMQFLADLSTLQNSHSRKAFEVGKAAAISETTINTYVSATAAYKALAGISVVGPALGAAAAAAAVAAGLANVQAINSASFGKSGRGVSSYGGGTPWSPVATQPTGQDEATQNVTIVLKGVPTGQWIEEELVPGLTEAGRRNVRIEYL